MFNRIMNQNKGGSDTSRKPTNERHHNGANGHHRNYRSYKNNTYSTSNSSYSSAGSPSVAVDLPKRDPVREAQDAVAALVGEQHVLPYCWTIWHHSRNKTKAALGASSDENSEEPGEAVAKAGADSYLQAASEIAFPCYGNPAKSVTSIASLEQMWVSMSLVKRTHELSNGCELLVFKTGVNPVWEDPINAKGGRWVFRFYHRANAAPAQEPVDSIQWGRKRATLVWERLVMKTLTGLLLPCRKDLQNPLLSDIAGLVLSVRRDEEIISVWNSNLHFSKKKDEDDKKGAPTAFHARRVYCDAILRVIREVDLILQGSDSIDTQATSLNERVSGVTFEYRLHADSSHSFNSDRGRRGKTYHHHHNHHKDDEDSK